jgi:DNA-directed RNA polymerase specialized sigma24 family protein
LGLLNPLMREVIVARFFDGESCADIARRLNKSEQTISGWIRRAIERLQFHLRSTPKNRGPSP